jgi:Zn-finger nucleic acid-binding protein
MACPNCDHTMHKIGKSLIGKDWSMWWCPRCGTIKDDAGKTTPKLVNRVVEFCGGISDHWQIIQELERTGVRECISLPGQR